METAWGDSNHFPRNFRNQWNSLTDYEIAEIDFRRSLREKKSIAKPIIDTFQSPSNGTDIISHPIALIRCKNQTQCIQPKLQLEKTFDVYYCKHVGHGVRFYFLVREGVNFWLILYNLI